MRMYDEKRGVSPLIATILLLAFAVALATVILNLDFNPCSASEVKYSTRNSLPRVCYNPGERSIEAFVTTQNTKVLNITMIVEGENDVSYGFINVNMNEDETKKINVPYDMEEYGKIISFKMVPAVLIGKDQRSCPIKPDIRSVPDC